MEEAAVDALRNDRFLRGENVVKFEEEFAKLAGTDYAVSTSSGTNALQFILIALELQGKKIVTSPNSFIASANAIVHANATPVFGDIALDYCLDAAEAENQLKAGAAGLLPVHIYGAPFDFDAFDELAKRYNVPVIEDACQAHGAVYKGRKVGGLGIAAAFSFYPSKNMTVLGDGGMVTTNDKRIADLVARMRDGGRSSWYEHDIMGYTSRLNTVNAAIGRVQLHHLRRWNERRRAVADLYRKNLKDVVGIALPPEDPTDTQSVYHQFVLRAERRDELVAFLKGNGVETAVHYPIPIHLQPIYIKLYGYTEGSYPKSEQLSKECLSLPMHPFLTDEDVRYVCETISRFVEGAV
jgi:perosamine synthetase